MQLGLSPWFFSVSTLAMGSPLAMSIPLQPFGPGGMNPWPRHASRALWLRRARRRFRPHSDVGEGGA